MDTLSRGESWYSNNEHLSTEVAANATVSNIKKAKGKKKEVTKKERVVYCSLNHAGHSNDSCYSQIIAKLSKDLSEMKSKSNHESAKMTSDVSRVIPSSNSLVDLPISDTNVHPSYYEEAFCARVEDTDDQITKSIENMTHLTYTQESHQALVSSSSEAISGIIFDSGASSHMFKDSSLFSTLQAIPPTKISVASKDGSIWASHQGSVLFEKLHLTNVLFSNQLTSNLVSIGRLCDMGFCAILRSIDGYILNNNQQVLMTLTRDPRSDRLWHPNIKETALHCSQSDSSKSK